MAKLSSKLISGATQIAPVKIHAAPVAPAKDTSKSPVSLTTPEKVAALNISSAVKLPLPIKFPSTPSLLKPIASLTAPTLIQKFPDIEDKLALTQPKFEVLTPANASLKTFTIQTGLPDDKPIIVLSSEFSPLYELGQRSFQGESIKLKQEARIVTAKTAITVMSQSSGASEAIDDNKNEIRSYIQSEYTFLNGLVSATNSAAKSLDVFSFSPTWSIYLVESIEPTTFPEILKRNGFQSQKVFNFCQTKLWQQNLVEIKKNLFTHTHGLLTQGFTRNNERDGDPFLLSDVTSPQRSTKRVWINPYGMEGITSISLSSKETYYANLQKLISFEDNKFINLVLANAPARKVASPGSDTITRATLSSSDNSNDGISISSNFLNTFENTPKDICVLANFLFKEKAYSSFLTSAENVSLLSTKYGYTVNKDKDNMSVWDHVIGRVQNSIFDFPMSPVGNDSSLVSLSQHSVKSGEDTYKILTFEGNYLQDDTITPGVFYYVDSSLNTADGLTFDTSRLNSLIRRVDEAQKTIKMVIDFSGFDTQDLFGLSAINNLGARYTKRQQFSAESIFEKFSVVSSLYRKCTVVNQGTGDISLNVKNMGVGILGGFSNEEVVAIRLASIICKAAVNPVSAYRQSSKSLKANLFMFLMNVVLKQSENYYNDEIISESKKKISDILGNVTVEIDAATLEIASEEKRNFPFAVGTSPDLSSGVEPVSNVEIFTAAESGLIFSDPRVRIDMNGTVTNWPQGSLWEETFGSPQAYWQNKVNTEIQEWVQSRRDQMIRARRRSYDIYSLGAATRLFEVSENRGIWKLMVDEMKSVYNDASLFDSDASIYSNLPKMAYMYVYFEMLIRSIAAQTPENLLGVYSGTRYFSENLNTDEYLATQTSFSVYENGFLIDKVTPEQHASYYDKNSVLVPSSSDRDCVIKLRDASSILRSEDEIFIGGPRLIRKFLLDLGERLNNFRSYLQTNFQPHLQRVNPLFQSDTSLDDKKKNGLLNLTFLQEQIRLTSYAMSEMSDRLNESDDYVSKLRSISHFSTFPENFENFMPVNEVELVSYHMLSSFFRSSEFLKAKGNNKRIISVGIPPKLIRTLRSDTRISTDNFTQAIKQGFVRLRVYKNNRLHPDIIYQPLSFLFDMNRYPTRSLRNWDYDAFATDTSDILKIPTKHVRLGTSQAFGIDPVSVHRNFGSAFPVADFQNLLSEEEKASMYRNHCVSFLLEEYLRWFTDCRFEETRYNNFGSLDNELRSISAQYQKYVDIARNSSVSPQSSRISPIGRKITARLTDFLNKSYFEIVIRAPQIDATLQRTAPISEKSYVIPMDDTLRSYFNNETFMLNPSVFKRRMSYPKKFDRVFNLIIDPDDFYVDESMSSLQTLNALRDAGIIIGGEQNAEGDKNPYKHRDTTPDDITMDEYFVTVEPFDYVQEYEG